MDLSMICSLMLCMCALNRVTIGQMDREIYIGELDKKEFGSFDSLTAPSAIACCVTCSWNELCKMVNYHKTTGECQLLPSPAARPEFLTDSPGWTWYHPEEGTVCYDTPTPAGYTGKQNITENGLTCQRWDEQYPHTHGMTEPWRYPDATASEAENYCRDPDGSGYLWCYTTSTGSRFGTCDIPAC